MATTTPERDGAATLLRLAAWLSPAFPVGSFAYSHGLERAVGEGRIPGANALREWISALIEFGSGWNDAVLFAQAHRLAADGQDFDELAQLGEALAGSAERHLETSAQGRAFVEAARVWAPDLAERLPADCPYPVAVGAFAGAQGIDRGAAVAVYLQAFATNLVQAAIRLGVVGQSDGVRVIAELEPLIIEAADRAANSSLDDLGSAAFNSDIMAIRHETQRTRIFRS